MKIGADYLGEGRCEFTVWAPEAPGLSVRLERGVGIHGAIDLPMKKDNGGYWKTFADGVSPGDRYVININSVERADPASHYQPLGVEGPSEVVDHSYAWTDAGWKGNRVEDLVIYELHAGSFTPEGTLEAIIPRLDELKGFGVNAIELMPLAQFPGERNWGYDGVFLYAVQTSYGGPVGLKRLVDECHRRGISVILDVVYNHFGPEGNYMADFGPYFTDRYRTPWGMAVNLDGPGSDGVREFFIENALFWKTAYHIDGLRLDAVHAIHDSSARHFLKELKERTEAPAGSPPFFIISESDLNDPRVIRERRLYGFNHDAMWCDDFHHALYSLLSDEKSGYLADFGFTWQFVRALREGLVYTGQYSIYRKRSFGAPPEDVPKGRFVVFFQNHDQIGNRVLGDRASSILSFEALKLGAGALLLSPHIPLIFMGEEYAEDAPFPYFISHTNEALIAATAMGRKEEFREFKWEREPMDPQSPETFLKSKLRWEDRDYGRHKVLLEFYRRLIMMRREVPALGPGGQEAEAYGMEDEKAVFLSRKNGASRAFVIFNFNRNALDLSITLPEGLWIKAIDSADEHWEGPGSGMPDVMGAAEDVTIRGTSLCVYTKEAL